MARERWRAGNQDVTEVTFAPPPSPPPAFDAGRLEPGDVDVLMEALGAESEWISDTACAILRTAGDPVIGQRAADRALGVPPGSRCNAVIVAVANAPSPPVAAARLLETGDPPSRVGAAAAASLLSGIGTADSWKPILDRARADDDMTVRFAAGTDRETAEKAAYWSCQECGQINEADVARCAFCRDGDRLGVRLVTVSAQAPARPPGCGRDDQQSG